MNSYPTFLTVLAAMLVLTACTTNADPSDGAVGEVDGARPRDASSMDGSTDASRTDAGRVDAAALDAPPVDAPLPPLPTDIPGPTDWVYQGEVLSRGASGWGAFGARYPSVLIKDGQYFMYYQSARTDRGGGRPGFRAVGVATSTDGRNFTKYAGNPVMTFFTQPGHINEAETGAMAPSAVLDSDGSVVLFYGALTAVSPCEVDVDSRVARAANGFDFTDQGILLSGDEIWPVGSLRAAGRTSALSGDWFLWFTVSGGASVGLAIGATPLSMTREPTNPVINEFTRTEYASPVLMADGTVYTYEVSGANWSGSIRVRRSHIDALDTYSPVVMVLELPGVDLPVIDPFVVPDPSAGVWRLYGVVDPSQLDRAVHLWTAPL